MSQRGSRVTAQPVRPLDPRTRQAPGRRSQVGVALGLSIPRGSLGKTTALAESIQVKEKIRLCSVCFNITESDPCQLLACTLSHRKPSASSKNRLMSLRSTEPGSFTAGIMCSTGRYLPSTGVGPEQTENPVAGSRAGGQIRTRSSWPRIWTCQARNCHLPAQAARPAGGDGDTAGQRSAGWRRPGVCGDELTLGRALSSRRRAI